MRYLSSGLIVIYITMRVDSIENDYSNAIYRNNNKISSGIIKELNQTMKNHHTQLKKHPFILYTKCTPAARISTSFSNQHRNPIPSATQRYPGILQEKSRGQFSRLSASI